MTKNFNWNTEASVLTHPTVGPLFGSFKLQGEYYVCPIRLYNGLLHNNALGIGLKMSQVKLPKLEVPTIILAYLARLRR